jgi:hypothetical protein
VPVRRRDRHRFGDRRRRVAPRTVQTPIADRGGGRLVPLWRPGRILHGPHDRRDTFTAGPKTIGQLARHRDSPAGVRRGCGDQLQQSVSEFTRLLPQRKRQ